VGLVGVECKAAVLGTLYNFICMYVYIYIYIYIYIGEGLVGLVGVECKAAVRYVYIY